MATTAAFNPEAALMAYARASAGRIERAAQYAEAQLRMRTPVKTGAMRGKVGVVIQSNGFILKVEDYVSWFVEKGHKSGSRRSSRARLLRQTAKALRKARKETGDESLKMRESEFRKAAKTEDKADAPRVAGRRDVPAHPFVGPTIDAIRPELIRILSGQA